MPRTRVTQAVAAVLTALLVPATAGAADARPLVQQHYSDVYDVLLPDPADPDGSFCGGLVDVPLHVEIDGYFSVKDHGRTRRLRTSPTGSARPWSTRTRRPG